MGALIVLLLQHGRHTSVTWSSQYSCHIRSRPFSESLGMQTTYVRRYLHHLYRLGYLTKLDYGHGYIDLTLKEPVDRMAS